MLYYCLLFLLFSVCQSSLSININLCDQTTGYGPVMFEHPLIATIEAHPIMQRLKAIDQSGPNVYFGYTPAFNRYEHSVGVWQLVASAGGNLEEQIAALLHDASHSAFSHLADSLHNMAEQDVSYQDSIHLEFLVHQGLLDILKNYPAISINDLDPHANCYKRLEQPLPELCADRIQYILFTGWRWGVISKTQMDFVIKSLVFENGTWIITNQSAGLLIGYLSLYFTQSLWGAPWNCALYYYFGKAVKQALELGLITHNEFYYGTDKLVLDKLCASDVTTIKQYLAACADIHTSFKVVYDQSHDMLYKPKCRAVNPLVMHKGKVIRLTELNQDYAQAFDETKRYCHEAIAIKFLHS